MKIDRLIGGICFGIGLTRLLLHTNHSWFNWALIGIGVLSLVLYLAERFIKNDFWEFCRKYDSMTPRERLDDCERRIARKVTKKCL